MINTEGVLSAVALADLLAEKGMTVVAKPNTVLSELVRFTNMELAPLFTGSAQGADQTGYANLAAMAHNVTAGTLEEPSTHTRFMDGATADIGKAVISHISFARNIVKPLVIDYAEGVTQHLANFAPPSAADQFCVEVVDLPELLEDESFVDTLTRYAGKSILRPDAIPALSAKASDELLALMLMGDKDADEAIAAWYTRKGEGFFLNIWENFFRNRQEANPQKLMSYDEIQAEDVFLRADYGLAMYLMAHKLYDSVDDAVQGVSLNAYRNIIAQTRDFAAALITASLLKITAYAKSRILVVSSNPDARCIKVFGTVYRPWLEQGGSPETILGLLVSEKRLSTQSAIDEIQQALLKQWKTHVVFHNTLESNKQFAYFKEALRVKFRALMLTLSAEETRFVDSTKDYVDKVNTLFTKELDSLKSSDMDNVHATALRLVCRARFYYTDAELILSDIIEAGRVNPDIDVREAAGIATMNYIFDYLSDQMSLSPM